VRLSEGEEQGASIPAQKREFEQQFLDPKVQGMAPHSRYAIADHSS
jgi:hypothetical protein